MNVPVQTSASTLHRRPELPHRPGARVRLATVRSRHDGLELDVYAAVVALAGVTDAPASLRMLEPTQIFRFLAGCAPSSGPDSAGVCA